MICFCEGLFYILHGLFSGMSCLLGIRIKYVVFQLVETKGSIMYPYIPLFFCWEVHASNPSSHHRWHRSCASAAVAVQLSNLGADVHVIHLWNSCCSLDMKTWPTFWTVNFEMFTYTLFCQMWVQDRNQQRLVSNWGRVAGNSWVLNSLKHSEFVTDHW